MKLRLTLIGTVLLASAAYAGPLKMPPAPAIELENASPHPLTAGLLLTNETRETVVKVKTSPFDRVTYPVGQYTVELFQKNLPLAFKTVVVAEDSHAATSVDLVVEVSIVRFEATVARPAYKPYTATMVYRADVYDRNGTKIFTQTAVGDGQTSKGMMSGLKAKGLCAQSASLAMVASAKQILEGLLDASELMSYR